ncbi:hypothetical protein SAMN05216588_116119 [Pseudomonas flavescens]|uniref:Strictosidine synthase n=1 Tax=Phytopseudomonas flavescens TaxID=29435 RepID=A0A1G8KFK3_9GAMM|nr:hypothetical protein [Pseudomonas flavescens]SDI42176.1 hypothetical protein SAMN05216588_116119 [Pseudomonas flavescens]
MPMSFFSARPVRHSLVGLASLLAMALLFFAWQQFYPVSAADGWSVRKLYDDVPRASGLALDRTGDLLVSEELSSGQGRILHIDASGQRRILLQGLSKPAGLLALDAGRSLAFSQEGGVQPVSVLSEGRVQALFEASNVQGIWADHDAALYAVEDRDGSGRLLRFDLQTLETTVLRDHLAGAEAVTGCPDGRLFYTEKTGDRVWQYNRLGPDQLALEALNKPSSLLCDERGLSVSEDSTHRARLLLLTPDGDLHVVLSHLKAPQSLLPAGEGRYLLAEGGRDRVLELRLQ